MSQSMTTRLDTLEQEALSAVDAAADHRELEELRVRLLGKKGALTAVLRGVAELPQDERPAAGSLVNALKRKLQEALDGRRAELDRSARAARISGPQLDVSLPAFAAPPGHLHPLSQTTSEVCAILTAMGFEVAEGPDVEDEYHNFEALNIPADHPARDMQDTFFVEDGRVLRTHTSPVQIRVMERAAPPLAIIAPGSVYRHDDDVTHSPMFHQVEGLLVDRNVHFGHLKYVLKTFLRAFFGAKSAVRFRPSYFPFTEPSAEADIACVICSGRGRGQTGVCRVCKGSGWLEILGAGMVDPAVFSHVGYDPEVFTGFAFGLGVDRLAMLRYGIDDIRLLYGGDLRFLAQF